MVDASVLTRSDTAALQQSCVLSQAPGHLLGNENYFRLLASTLWPSYTETVTDTIRGSCAHVKPDGRACLARPQNGSEYCFFHDPRTAEKRHESRRQGGIERTRNKAVLSPSAAKIRIRGTADVVKLTAATIQQVRCGRLEVRIANSIAQLAGVGPEAY